MAIKKLNDITDDFEAIASEEKAQAETYNKKTRSRSSAPAPDIDEDMEDRVEMTKRAKKNLQPVKRTNGMKNVVVESHLGTFRGTFYIDTGYFKTRITEKAPQELPLSVIAYLKNKTHVVQENGQAVRRRTFSVTEV